VKALSKSAVNIRGSFGKILMSYFLGHPILSSVHYTHLTYMLSVTGKLFTFVFLFIARS